MKCVQSRMGSLANMSRTSELEFDEKPFEVYSFHVKSVIGSTKPRLEIFVERAA